MHQRDGHFLYVRFFDVGQGDSVFITTPGGKQILIDGGDGSGVLRELGSVMPFYDRSIDVVIATHPDKDHIGGLPDVFDRFDVDLYVHSSVLDDGALNFALLEAALEESVVIEVVKPLRITLDDITLRIMFPNRDASYMEKNAASLVIQIVYADNTFLLTGDAPKSIETYLVSRYKDALESDVLKVGHHGSKTSSDSTFLHMVDPTYAVISAGAQNRYGHPHKDVLQELTKARVSYFETKHGSVTFYTDGAELFVEQ